MKIVSRIFSACICSASLFAFSAYGVVATTSGSDLTGYNPSNSYNNQWSSATNARYDGSVTAKADFGNCNALVLRCAQPKCANGGCGEMNIASSIVAGCVKSNSKCKQYGDDLIQFMSAQLVADSNAKINASNAEQVAAAQQAAEQAQMAAQQAAAAQQQQMMEMQNSMQQQMMEMQQQMAEQNAQSAQQIADALAQSQQQQAAAISEMQSAAQSAAQAQIAGGMSVTERDEAAISRGVSADVMEREKISGQIITELDNAKTQLKEVQVAMESAFTYAGCDNRGDNCGMPKRIKKWRELAGGFLSPYDAVVESVYDALITAQTVGVDMSDIYMMLNNSCNSWGEYLCPPGDITYDNSDDKGQKGAPSSCSSGLYASCSGTCSEKKNQEKDECYKNCEANFKKTNCKPCTLLKILNNKDDVYQGWIETDNSSRDNQKVIACASQALANTALFKRRMRSKNGAGIVDIEQLDRWINQKEPTSLDGNRAIGYCGVSDVEGVLQTARISKSIPKKASLCVEDLKIPSDKNNAALLDRDLKEDNSDDCAYIRPVYSICDTHVYNYGKSENLKSSETSEREKMNNVISAKITVLSQQMYKQYEYLSATLRRLRTQLQKSVLTASLEMAGASSNGGGSGSSGRGNDKAVVLAGAENCSNKTSSESVYSCIQNNVSLIITSSETNSKQACKQLKATLESADLWDKIRGVGSDSKCANVMKNICNKKEIVPCAQALQVKVIQTKEKEQNERNQPNFIMMRQ